MNTFYVYILKCSDRSYYVGHTDDLAQRMSQHTLGLIKGYTFLRRPVELVWMQTFHSRDAAFVVERKLKGWTRRKKEAVIKGEWLSLSDLSKERKIIE